MRLIALLALAAIAAQANADDWLYLTYPGDTLIGIGKQYLKNPDDWPKVQTLNRVTNPRHLPTNTRIRIPVALLKVTPAPAVVTHVEGNVRVRPADGVFRPLAVGDALTGGETVLTGPRSFASFRLADGSLLSEQPSSKLTFGRLAAWGKTGMVATELNLAEGRLEAGASKQIPPAGGMRVITPVAVAGLRGTAFRLNLGEDGKTLRNEVLEGTVGVSAENQEVLVGSGQGTVAEAGKPPSPPRPLLPAPSGEGLPARVVDLPLAFQWAGDGDARHWRAQVARDTAFQRVLLESLEPRPAVSWDTDLPDGRYVLRIRAVDRDGLEGFNLDHPFELAARPLPPLPTAPAEGARSLRETVLFEWSAAAEAQGYRLQLSGSPDFAPGTTVERTLGALLRHGETLAAGTHFWRIASLDEQGGAHGWSAPRSFRVQPLPAAPRVETRADDGRASFAWQPVGGAAEYELEVDDERTMARPEARLRVAQPKAAIPLKSGRYFWRIRSVEADGQSGDWSKVGALLMPPEAPADIRVRQTRDALELDWKGSAPAFRLEFARDAQFTRPLFRHREAGNASRLAWPEPGNYWVRVTALGENGEPGGRSQPVAFQVRSWKW